MLGDVENERIDVSALARATECEERQARALPQPGGGPAHHEPLRALLLRRARTRAVDHLDEHGDPVAFGDRLAQQPCTRHES